MILNGNEDCYFQRCFICMRKWALRFSSISHLQLEMNIALMNDVSFQTKNGHCVSLLYIISNREKIVRCITICYFLLLMSIERLSQLSNTKKNDTIALL